MNGQGEYHYKDGDVYVGEWMDDQKHGEGTYQHKDGEKYVGKWVKNQKEGEFKVYKSGEEEPQIVNFKDNKQIVEGKDKNEEVKLQVEVAAAQNTRGLHSCSPRSPIREPA